jgi:hypothetical protein
VAPLTDEQFAPALSHRSHWYAYEMSAVPDQEPLEPLNVEPLVALPVTVGRLVFDGAIAAWAVGATISVCAEVADFEPDEFVAVTNTRIVPPASAVVKRYVAEFAPAIDAQPAPAASQRRHWYA